jgi:hypothetical protein
MRRTLAVCCRNFVVAGDLVFAAQAPQDLIPSASRPLVSIL